MARRGGIATGIAPSRQNRRLLPQTGSAGGLLPELTPQFGALAGAELATAPCLGGGRYSFLLRHQCLAQSGTALVLVLVSAAALCCRHAGSPGRRRGAIGRPRNTPEGSGEKRNEEQKMTHGDSTQEKTGRETLLNSLPVSRLAYL